MSFQFYNDKTEKENCLFVCSNSECGFWFTRTLRQLIFEKKRVVFWFMEVLKNDKKSN